MSMASTRASQTGARYRGSVIKASLMGGVSGFAFGLWRNGLPNSPWMAAGATAAAAVAVYWMLAAVRLRKPSMANAAANVRAAVAGLPPLARLLLLPPPAKPSPARPAPSPSEPSVGSQTSARETLRDAVQRGTAEDERARLKSQGYNDAEISQILIMRETGNATAKGGFGTGTAAGAFLNNLDAVLAYARHLVPSFKSDLERMFDERGGKADRIGGALSFSLKCAALGVLGYFLYLEAIEFKARALDMWGKACITRQQNAINHATLNELMSGKTLDSDDDCRTK